MSISEIQAVYEQHTSEGKARAGRPRFLYGDDGEFEALAVCPRADLPDLVHRVNYPTAKQWPDGQVAHVPWTQDRLRDALAPTMRRIRGIYGGEWILLIVSGVRTAAPMQRSVGTAHAVEQQILAGPDTPGRRFLQRIGRATASDQATRTRELATAAMGAGEATRR
jgi:hypothetical protein